MARSGQNKRLILEFRVANVASELQENRNEDVSDESNRVV
jgi:hypothetical protein